MKKRIFVNSRDELINIVGQQDKKLKELEERYNVKIFYFENDTNCVIEIFGSKKNIENVSQKLITDKNSDYKSKDIQTIFKNEKFKDNTVIFTTYNNKHIVALSENQKKYTEAIKNYDIVVGIGPAGTGKTYLAVATGLSMLRSGKVSKIILTRPVVESGEKLGFLPGDLYEKINPYLKPLYDAFYVMLGPEKFHRYKNDEIIEIIPLAYMRGRTLEQAYIILDEAQNTVNEQIKMFLTRMGQNSQIVITGDITQIDLEKKSKSGLVLIEQILKNIEGIKFVYFNEKDVIRHKLVKEIIKAYEKWENKK